MTTKVKTLGAGALYGVIAGTCAGVIVMRLVPSVGHPVTMRHLPWDLAWAASYSLPIGLPVGAVAGAFMYWRANRLDAFPRLIIETSILAAAATAAFLQAALPVAWQLPRARITVAGAVAAAVCGSLGTIILKPIYWPTRSRSS